MPFVTEKKNLSSEPVANWNTVQVYTKPDSFESSFGASFDEGEGDPELIQRPSGASAASAASTSQRGSFNKKGRRLSTSLRNIAESLQNNGILLELLKHSERPSDMHDVHDVEYNEVSGAGIG
jgi:hypothetical protein